MGLKVSKLGASGLCEACGFGGNATLGENCPANHDPGVARNGLR